MNFTQHVVSTLPFSHYLFSFKIPCFLDPARAAISEKRREQLGQKRIWTLAFQRPKRAFLFWGAMEVLVGTGRLIMNLLWKDVTGSSSIPLPPMRRGAPMR
jgi:hypothetical protein